MSHSISRCKMNKPHSQTRRMLMALVLAMSCSQSLMAQLRAEYWFDFDPGRGQATSIEVTADGDGNFNFSAPTSNLAPGTHLLGIRVFNPGTPTYYAPTILRQIFVPSSEVSKISSVEYFWDNDPGVGKATALAITPGHELNLSNMEIPTTGVSQGTHLLGLRAFGEQGWSPVIIQKVYVPDANAGEGNIQRVEYFWDTDPGFGNGIPLTITPAQEVDIDNVQIPINGLSSGNHQLFLRAYGDNGWTPTISQTVGIEPDVTDYKVNYAEYFWNNDPGFGKGTPIQLTPGETVSVENLNLSTNELHGDAVLFVRYYGEKGWSPTVAYTMFVDAAGDYTLNANAATSADTKNYKTIDDAFDDFADRGISDNITLTVKTTTTTTYALDATDEERIAQIGQMAQNLERISGNDTHKTIAFTATNTKNTVSVTTTAEGLPAVVSLFAQTSWTKVALKINGVSYNFNHTSLRHQVVDCSTTAKVALGSVSDAIKATWKAQPHEGTTLSGFVAEGEGDLPEMTITNSGTQTDYLAYLVTLSTADGQQELCSYTYYMYVRAKMQNQSFTSLLPASGITVDPGTVTLQWNAFNDATGYRVVVNETAEGGEPSQILNTVTDQTQYNITVKTGYTYTWTVTAIGACDELCSAEQTLRGRVLPDFIVESIALPEAAPTGSELTVTAIIKNQGAGASIEGTWTDRLYYTVNSTKFADAVQAADVTHEGNVGIGESYEVSFTMQVPFVDNGTLRVFVEANADQTVMETNATAGNNRKMCTSTAAMSPLYVDEGDLAALRQLYEDFCGSEWNGTKWSTGSSLVTSSNWSGVTFNSNGNVTAINLQDRNLTGALDTATPLMMPELKTLNLSRNALTGDPAIFVNNGATPLLTTLDLGYNQIDELSAALPATITTLTLTYQHRTYNKNAVLKGLDNLTVQVINAGKDITIDVPAIVGYNHKTQTLGNIQTLNVWKYDMSQRLGSLEWSVTKECYAYKGYVGIAVQPQEQDEMVILVPTDGPAKNSAYPASFHMVKGDVNLSGWVDVNDVQRTLNYIINSNNSGTFSRWAANTWEDDLINIQDIVCTVNIVLDNQGEGGAGVRKGTRQTDAANCFYASGHAICLDAQDEIAAFDLTLEGVNSSQVRLLLNSTDWQMQTRDTESGLRLVVFSPTGQTLPAGHTQLLRLSAEGTPIGVQATSAGAEELPASTRSEATRIEGTRQDGSDDSPVYDLQGRRVDMNAGAKSGKVYIKNGKKVMK